MTIVHRQWLDEGWHTRGGKFNLRNSLCRGWTHGRGQRTFPRGGVSRRLLNHEPITPLENQLANLFGCAAALQPSGPPGMELRVVHRQHTNPGHVAIDLVRRSKKDDTRQTRGLRCGGMQTACALPHRRWNSAHPTF